jgi:SpoVK/Ycf46/Vps4 family AAA+-type ATPase
MNANTHFPMSNMQHQNLFDSMKPMLLTMMMVNTNKDNSQNNVFNTIWSLLMLGVIDWIISNMKHFTNFFLLYGKKYLHQTINNKITEKIKANVGDFVKSEIKSIITMPIIDLENQKTPIIHAILDLITNLPDTKSISLMNNIFTLSYYEPIKITNDIYIKLNTANKKNNENNSLLENEMSTNDKTTPNHYLEMYSYSSNMKELREELDIIVRDYLNKIKNKLGNQIYYFRQLNSENTKTANISNSNKSNIFGGAVLQFNMKVFHTNRQFINLFGEEISLIRKRVDFFRDNRKWYDQKGIPYTLGILMSGEPGAGKTSTIKCLANELKRHIVSIQLTNNMTKTQLESIFFDEILNITQGGKTEQFAIPIDKRVFVLEDVDCECDIVLERKDKEEERNKDKYIEELEMQVTKLKEIINNPQQNKTIIMNSSNVYTKDTEKKEDSDKITLSFLLNLLDGILETPGRIIIMTTNFLNKLDSELIRPGRFDITVHFTKCNVQMMLDMIRYYYDIDNIEEQYVKRITLLENNIITPAELSKVLFENIDNIENAIISLEKIKVNKMIGGAMSDPINEENTKIIYSNAAKILEIYNNAFC